jgi:hypothetical protein
MADRIDEPSSPATPSAWSAGRIVIVVIASIGALVALAMLAAATVLTWAATTQRDDTGYFHTDTKRFSTASYALVSEDVDLGTDRRPRGFGFEPGDIVRVRVRGSSGDRDQPVFIGIARSSDVDRYLSGVAHDVIRDVRLRPFEVEYDPIAGATEPAVPPDQTFWVASSAGPGPQTVTWEPTRGTWSIVLMNADAARGVVADVDVGVEVRHLWVIVGAVWGLGLVLLAGAITVIIIVSHRAARAGVATPITHGAAATPVSATAVRAPTAEEPIAVRARLDSTLSRWKWLVKWLLAIPHLVVLLLLWVAAVLLTIVAGIAIVFTGRYPRRIFDFNAGVLRWTWRVSFYATGVMGTDRYPPFTLGDAPDYPASLDVTYPLHLSRGLVLVKWWLLAIPHYVIVGIIGTGWWWGWLRLGRDWGGRGDWGGGLLGVLVLVAGVRLLFTGRYPREMFDLVTGLNRWVFRVLVYALLMTDAYPPFRLDQGGDERRDDGQDERVAVPVP